MHYEKKNPEFGSGTVKYIYSVHSPGLNLYILLITALLFNSIFHNNAG